MNIFEEIYWPQFVQLEHIKHLSLNEQITQYNQYVWELNVARQSWLAFQNKGSYLNELPVSYTITFEIEVENDTNFFRFGVEVIEDASTNITIDWGDGSPTESGTITYPNQENFQYTYPTAGNYTVSVLFSEPSDVYAIYADQND